MQIIDKYGYLENALDYIDRYLVSGRGLQKTAKKARISEDFLKKLSSSLKGFSEKQLLTSLQEKIEDRHSSISGAEIEVSGVDISVETIKANAFILMKIICDVVVDGDQEDKIKIDVKMFSKNNIQIQAG